MWSHIAIVSPPLISWIICLLAPANRRPVLGQLGGSRPMRGESVGYNTGQCRHSDLMAATIITDEELTSTYRIRNYFNPLHSTISVSSLIHETYIVSNYCFQGRDTLFRIWKYLVHEFCKPCDHSALPLWPFCIELWNKIWSGVNNIKSTNLLN